MIRNAPKEAAVFGVDLGKNLFHVVGLDARGSVIQRAKFRRDTVLAFFQRAAPTLVGMEACLGSQWFARKLQAFGHEVRIVPAQSVKPFVKSQKNDTIDAEPIAEAVPDQRCASPTSVPLSRSMWRHCIECVISWSPVVPGWSTKPELSVSNTGLPCDKALALSGSIFPVSLRMVATISVRPCDRCSPRF